MADRDQRYHQQLQHHRGGAGAGGGGLAGDDDLKSTIGDNTPTASQVLTVAILFPVGGLLLTLAGLALAASVIGLVVATPVFLLFSPVLVPVALLMGLSVTGFIASGALGLGGLSSLSCFASTARCLFQRTPEYVEHAKRKVAEAAAEAGQRTRDAGQMVANKANEVAGKTT